MIDCSNTCYRLLKQFKPYSRITVNSANIVTFFFVDVSHLFQLLSGIDSYGIKGDLENG